MKGRPLQLVVVSILAVSLLLPPADAGRHSIFSRITREEFKEGHSLSLIEYVRRSLAEQEQDVSHSQATSPPQGSGNQHPAPAPRPLNVECQVNGTTPCNTSFLETEGRTFVSLVAVVVAGFCSVTCTLMCVVQIYRNKRQSLARQPQQQVAGVGKQEGVCLEPNSTLPDDIYVVSGPEGGPPKYLAWASSPLHSPVKPPLPTIENHENSAESS